MMRKNEERDSDDIAVVRRGADGVALITLNRPRSLNAIDHDVLRRLSSEFASLDDDNGVRVVVITGSGGAFSAGLDMKRTGFATGADGLDRAPRAHRNQEHVSQLITQVIELSKPTIAAINGACVGAGFGLALATDMRIASESAYFMAPFVRLGLSGGDAGLSWLLPRALGTSRAMEILYTGRRVPATEALQIGMVSQVVSSEDYLSVALALAADVAQRDELALRLTKRVLWSNAEATSLRSALELENRTQTFAAMNGLFYQNRDAFGHSGTDGEAAK